MNYEQYIGKTYELILQPKSKSEPEEVVFKISIDQLIQFGNRISFEGVINKIRLEVK
jgi:hypothetical protein